MALIICSTHGMSGCTPVSRRLGEYVIQDKAPGEAVVEITIKHEDIEMPQEVLIRDIERLPRIAKARRLPDHVLEFTEEDDWNEAFGSGTVVCAPCFRDWLRRHGVRHRWTEIRTAERLALKRRERKLHAYREQLSGIRDVRLHLGNAAVVWHLRVTVRHDRLYTDPCLLHATSTTVALDWALAGIGPLRGRRLYLPCGRDLVELVVEEPRAFLASVWAAEGAREARLYLQEPRASIVLTEDGDELSLRRIDDPDDLPADPLDGEAASAAASGNDGPNG